MTLRLSVIVPAFNEAARIGSSLERLSGFAAAFDGGAEVVVVDDGSADDTSRLALEAARATNSRVRLVRLPQNRGKGAALRAGVAEAGGAEILLCDADLSTPIEEYHRLREHLDEVDLVLGSRALPDSRITLRQPWHREAMGKAFNRLVRWFVVDGFRDTQCGFKLLRGDAGRALFAAMVIDRFAFDVELVWLALRRGLVVREVGIVWHDSPVSRVHPLRDSARMLYDVLRIRWQHRRERVVPSVRSAMPAPSVPRLPPEPPVLR